MTLDDLRLGLNHESELAAAQAPGGPADSRLVFDAWQAHKQEQAVAYDEAVTRLRTERDALQILIVVEGQGGSLGAPAPSEPATPACG